ncbi:hypothetical protein CAC42_4878 [Sphaceloma murrayae]|uniref:F-box domain-containing protein n=1 Tax=Sphaceloma murrayae TaxID=2082308 RepID=A0A2K1QP85_9PEZI|nr:hypothetical protein CAC42_4878 [Sphaceloma murrayae]
MAAVKQTFSDPFLLEQILLHTNLRDMAAWREVSTASKALVEISPLLRRKLFLDTRPLHPLYELASVLHRLPREVCEAHLGSPYIQGRVSTPIINWNPVFAFAGVEGNTIHHNGLPKTAPGSFWCDMLACQPLAQECTVTVLAIASGTTRQVVRREEGVTVGDILAAIRAKDIQSLDLVMVSAVVTRNGKDMFLGPRHLGCEICQSTESQRKTWDAELDGIFALA